MCIITFNGYRNIFATITRNICMLIHSTITTSFVAEIEEGTSNVFTHTIVQVNSCPDAEAQVNDSDYGCNNPFHIFLRLPLVSARH